jgi:hypothetical protein
LYKLKNKSIQTDLLYVTVRLISLNFEKNLNITTYLSQKLNPKLYFKLKKKNLLHLIQALLIMMHYQPKTALIGAWKSDIASSFLKGKDKGDRQKTN